MPEPLSPWWSKVHDAAQVLVSQLNASVSHATRVGIYTPPPGSAPPRRRRQPGSLRHLAEAIRSHRLAPGRSFDKDDVAGVLSGDLRHLTNPALVVAVARASHLIADVPFNDVDADRLVVASSHVSALVEAAKQADKQVDKQADKTALPAPRPTAEIEPLAQPVVIDAYFTTRRPRRRRTLVAGALSIVVVAGTAALLSFRNQEPDDQPTVAPSVATVAAGVRPLEHAHASDDHLNPRPLLDALEHGFTSIETDVVPRDDNLMLCRRPGAGCQDRSFTATYLQGLSARVSATGGRVYPGYHQPVFLFVKITCVEVAGGCRLPADTAEAAADPNNPLVVARKIMSALVPYRSMLFHVDGTARRWGPVQVVLTGRHNDEQVPAGAGGYDSVRGLLSRQSDTYTFLDGSFDVDRDLGNADLVPVISFQDPAVNPACSPTGEQLIQQVHWDNIIKAQTTGHHVRVWDVIDCPDRDASWTEAVHAGVDLISSNHVAQLGDWLTVNAVGGGGGDCAPPAWIAEARLWGQQCTLVTGDVPVMSRPDPRSPRAGSLVQGGVTWFLGQQPGEPHTYQASTNFWWAYTRAGNGQWGWVSLAYFIDGGRDQSADGLQYGCYDVRAGEPDTCHPI